MKLSLYADTDGKTVAYAKTELWRVLTAMDEKLTTGNGCKILLRVLPHAEGKDIVDIDVRNGNGYIAGEDPRGLLIAVYRFLYYLGCRWTVPGPFGEHIPKKTLKPEDLNVRVHEEPTYRYRGICIEGAVSEENVLEMIEFIPRVGMNAYFVQFHRPDDFFKRWYNHLWNETLPKEELTEERMNEILAHLAGAIDLRGLQYQSVGHGWTCEPFGVRGGGWDATQGNQIPQEYFDMVAEVKGERKLWREVPLCTNLCYSQERVREKIKQAVVDYCRENPRVDVVHFWLADALNNQCECADCKKKTPADWYVMMLNEIDEALTAAGIQTKIVFLLYFDLLWAPVAERLKNQDRFILMFAPITRTYSETLAGALAKGGDEPSPYVRNGLTLPNSVYTNIAFLKQWQQQFGGDSFLFDYHMMWDHGRDLGYTECARVVFEDMQNLDLLGLNGMISCQLSRVGFPTGLPLYAMAAALWNKKAVFEDVVKEYFTAEFGDEGMDVYRYLCEVSHLLDPRYLRRELPAVDPMMAAQFRRIPALVNDFRTTHPKMRQDSENDAWRTLGMHADILPMFAEMLAHRAEGQPRWDMGAAIVAYMDRVEPRIQRRIDLWNFGSNAVGQLEVN